MSLPQEKPRALVPHPLNPDFLAPSSIRRWQGRWMGGLATRSLQLPPSFAVPGSGAWRLDELGRAPDSGGPGSTPWAWAPCPSRVRQLPSLLQAAVQSGPGMSRPWG